MKIDLDWQKYEFNNEVFCYIKPLGVAALQKVGGFFGEQTKPGDDLSKIEEKLSVMNPLSDPKFAEIMKEIIPNYAKDLTNLEIKFEGSSDYVTATIRDLVEHDELMLTAVTLFGRIVSISSLTMEDRKSLKKPLEG